MPGDYTRLTFDPLLDRAMLLEQQGRVHLDADFNELAAIIERRLRVETRDIVGAAVYPAIEADSFKIKGAPSGPWVIGRGRMYVDGLLAENHGFGPLGYEPVWAEPLHDGDTPVGKQPYVGTPQTPPIGKLAHALAYLDVWQRERTYVEDPKVLEPSLGVDTATRMQTVWQVRGLKLDGDGMSCASDWSTYGPWQALIRPSDARLSSAAVAPPAPADPCAVAPVGGYRGLENRLYRIEIHDGGAPGTATLKWSRDNGAVASRITALTGATVQPIITVERLGRDDVLRFHTGEWVELLDDVLELDGKPGLMGLVLDTDETQSTVTLSAPLTGTIDLGRNPRLRRWDQKAGVNAAGVIPLTTSPQTIALEDGIEVTITIAGAGATAHVGDWWVFAARSSIGAIEELDDAPPRGIRHHFARLAVLHGGHVEDCRTPWPGECECEDDCGCTRCVTPETHQDDKGPLTIQAAIEQVRPSGGRVCLAPGRYRLESPLNIAGAHGLTLAGDGVSTIIESPPDLGIVVEDSIDVTLERFVLLAQTRRTDSKTPKPSIGIALVNTADCYVQRCVVVPSINVASTGIGLAGFALRTRLLENIVLAGTAIGDIVVGEKVNTGSTPTTSLPQAAEGLGSTRASETNVKLFGTRTQYLATLDLAVEDNLLLGIAFGIRFGSTAVASRAARAVVVVHAAATRIARNLVLGGLIAGLALLGLTVEGSATGAPDPEATPLATALSLALLRLARVDVRENVILASGDGIQAVLEELLIVDNTIHGRGTASISAASGVHIGGSSAVRTSAYARIAGNTIADQPSVGVFVDGGSGTVEVSGNRVMRTGLGGFDIQSRGEGSDARVIDNVLEDIAARVGGQDNEGAMTAIGVSGASNVAVSDNLLRAFAGDRGPRTRIGVHVTGGEVVHVDGNQLLDLGPVADYIGVVAGIVLTPTGVADVRGNTVRIPAKGDRPTSIAVRITAKQGAVDPNDALNALIWRLEAEIAALKAQVISLGFNPNDAPGPTEPVPHGLVQVAVHGNTLHAGGRMPVVRVDGWCNATFADNRCRWMPGRRDDTVVQVIIDGGAIVSANHVESPDGEDSPVMVIAAGTSTRSPHATVLGNISHGWIQLNGVLLGSPWAALNINA